jgi:hypothetical protein
MHVRVVGHHLPGRRFAQPEGMLTNVHVAMQVRADPVDPVPGDAPGAQWDVDVIVVDDEKGRDFRGPVVQGRRGERFVYLTWGEVLGPGLFHMFRRAKLMLDDIDPDLVERAQHSGVLVGSIDLTDERGGPRCARVRAPALVWSSADA